MERGKDESKNWMDERIQTMVAFVCATMLVFASVTLPVDRERQFWQYVTTMLLLCLAIPLALTKAFGWQLSDVGFRIGNVRRSMLWVAISMALMLPALIACARMPQFQSYYPIYTPAKYSATAFVELAFGMSLYMFAWEFLFRGFMLFSLRRSIGLFSIPVQAIPFWLAHIGKPQIEFFSSLPGGIVSGLIAWHCDSFLPMFVIHAAINVLLNGFVIILGG